MDCQKPNILFIQYARQLLVDKLYLYVLYAYYWMIKWWWWWTWMDDGWGACIIFRCSCKVYVHHSHCVGHSVNCTWMRRCNCWKSLYLIILMGNVVYTRTSWDAKLSAAPQILYGLYSWHEVVLFADKFLSKEIGFITMLHSIPIDELSRMRWHGNANGELNAVGSWDRG